MIQSPRSYLLALLAALLAAPALAQAPQTTLDKVRKTGSITLGYIDGAAPFSFVDSNGEPAGYSVELCRTVADGVAAQLKRQSLKVRWVKLTIQNRIDAVRKGQVDLECSTTTWTLSRQQLVDFSLVTFVDGGSLLVKATSEVGRVADFDGKRIAVIGGTTTEKSLRGVLARNTAKTEVVLVKTREEGLALLSEGQVEALASDRTALIGVVVMSGATRGAYKLLDQDFSIEQYALMMKRGDHDFRLAVNRVLARIYRSGEIEKIYDRWLGPLGPPSVLLSATYFIQNLAE
ncbi:MAG TPA: amino acid ABC transporter substrate-binding protein [Burkholderiales bacterium]|nr:amino acid ABC transporter substrate-binding protein [Burkholderiales bacterium]